MLLEQCMGDVADGDPQSAAQLAGLPLAPLADGRRGTLCLAARASCEGPLQTEMYEPCTILENVRKWGF